MRARPKRLAGWMALVALTLVTTAGLGWQRWQTTLLRATVEPLRDENRELARLRSERERLNRALPPAYELSRLRADHVEILRLRAELATLGDSGR